MKNPKPPCPYCDLFLISSYHINFNKLYCHNNHYSSYWSKEGNDLISETFVIGFYQVQNIYLPFLDYKAGAIISKQVTVGPKTFSTIIITLPDPLKMPITLEKIEGLIIFS